MIFRNTTKFRLVAGNQSHAENQNEEEMLYYCFYQTLFKFSMGNVRFLYIKQRNTISLTMLLHTPSDQWCNSVVLITVTTDLCSGKKAEEQ